MNARKASGTKRARGADGGGAKRSVSGTQQQALVDEQMRRLVDDLPVAAVHVAGGSLRMNEAAEAMTGYLRAEIPTLDAWFSVLHGDGAADARRACEEDSAAPAPRARSVSIRRKDGQERAIEISARSGEGREVWVLRDVTEERQVEAALAQSRKMEALGGLASGIAHDFNNLLAGILGCADIALGTLDGESPARPWIDALKSAARNGASVVAQLMAFSRGRDLAPEIVDLCAAVARSERMLRRVVGEDIDFRVTALVLEATVRCSPGAIEQLLMNLVTNARHAMPGGGALHIEIARTTLGAADAPLLRGLEPGPYVTLTVRDAGCGMDEDVQARAFEPFFTARLGGGGSGLGLSTVHGIAQQCGGGVTIASQVGLGTTVTVYLPHALRPADEERAATPAASQRRRRTVLVVEDDPLVRVSVRHYLESAGYGVIEASHGAEALAAARSQPRPVDLLLTDMVLPGMGGARVARSVQASSPGTRVLFMSAGAPEALAEQGGVGPSASTLQKPFNDRELLDAVHQALERPAAPLSPVGEGPAPDRDPVGPPRRIVVLLVEDSDLSRMTTRTFLEEEGFDVIEAGSVEEAERRCREHVGTIDVLLTDVALPDGSGGDVVDAVRGIQPGLCVLYVSGYPADDPSVVEAIREHGAAFLQKPVDADRLTALLRLLLQAS